MKKRIIYILFFIAISNVSFAAQKPIILDPSYNHDRFNTQPTDIIKSFRAYTASFDSNDDNNGDGVGDTWGIPEWVSYEVKRFSGECIPTRPRPSWFSDNDLVARGIAPTDASYRYSRNWRSLHPDWYERGHLAMKLLAERLGHDAAHNTHSLLNAVPQRKKFNKGIWQELENLTGAWAQQYGAVWVITGPVIIDGKPSGWIGEEGEFPVAIPDAIFKIVIKESGNPQRPDVLAFLYPQIGQSFFDNIPHPHQNYLVSVDFIEKLTNLDFFTNLPESAQEEIETNRQQWLWGVDDQNFIKACRR